MEIVTVVVARLNSLSMLIRTAQVWLWWELRAWTILLQTVIGTRTNITRQSLVLSRVQEVPSPTQLQDSNFHPKVFFQMVSLITCAFLFNCYILLACICVIVSTLLIPGILGGYLLAMFVGGFCASSCCFTTLHFFFLWADDSSFVISIRFL